MTQDTKKRLQGALMRIRGDHPFFGTLGLFADVVVTEDVGTAATDGKRLLFNPEYEGLVYPKQGDFRIPLERLRYVGPVKK